MWKIIIAFVLFAVVALFALMKGGDVDMSGEQHGIETAPAPAPSTSAAAQ